MEEAWPLLYGAAALVPIAVIPLDSYCIQEAPPVGPVEAHHVEPVSARDFFPKGNLPFGENDGL